MKGSLVPASALSVMLGLAAGHAFAAAPADWSKVPTRKITVFYPGVSPMEWIMKVTDHSGAKGLKKGESCASCHDEEAADMGRKMVTGQRIEPTPPKGKAGSIPVTVQAAHDDENIYLRFTWKQPPVSGGARMDADNPVKLAFMLEDNKVPMANLSGCWAACHQDDRTMPDVKDDTKTKHVTGGSLTGGKFYDLLQWKSGKGAKPVDGYVADKRVMEGGKALVSADGKQSGDTWTVTFARKLSGVEGDVAIVAGRSYNFGLAIHDDGAAGRFHHVSLGYTLGLDNVKADINAVRQ